MRDNVNHNCNSQLGEIFSECAFLFLRKYFFTRYFFQFSYFFSRDASVYKLRVVFVVIHDVLKKLFFKLSLITTKKVLKHFFKPISKAKLFQVSISFLANNHHIFLQAVNKHGYFGGHGDRTVLHRHIFLPE